MYTEKWAPEISNVWYARDIGTKSLLPYLKSDTSLIVHTDADCKILKGYIEEVLKYFIDIPDNLLQKLEGDLKNIIKRPEIATGSRRFIEDTGRKNKHIFDMYNWITDLEQKIFTFIFQGHVCNVHYKDMETIHMTPGSHTIFTKGLFKKIGWFDHIGWAEDVHIWMTARKLQHTVHYIREAIISTKARLSNRTTKWHGLGHEIERKWGKEDFTLTLVRSIKNHTCYIECSDILTTAHTQFSKKKGAWKNFVYTSMCHVIPNISKSDIQHLANIYFRFIGGYNSHKNLNLVWMMPSLFSELRILIKKYHPDIPLIDLAKELDKALDFTYKSHLPIASKSVDFPELVNKTDINYETESHTKQDELYIDFIDEKLSVQNLLHIAERFEMLSIFRLCKLLEKWDKEYRENQDEIFFHMQKLVTFLEINPKCRPIFQQQPILKKIYQTQSPLDFTDFLDGFLMILSIIRGIIIVPYYRKVCFNYIDKHWQESTYLESELYQKIITHAEMCNQQEIRKVIELYDNLVKKINVSYNNPLPFMSKCFDIEEFEYISEVIEVTLNEELFWET